MSPGKCKSSARLTSPTPSYAVHLWQKLAIFFSCKGLEAADNVGTNVAPTQLSLPTLEFEFHVVCTHNATLFCFGFPPTSKKCKNHPLLSGRFHSERGLLAIMEKGAVRPEGR